MAIYKSEKYVWNSTTSEWDLYYDKTSADNIVETSGAKVLTAAERTKISDYLSTFNIANKLVQLNASGKIPSELIVEDFADYLKRDGSNVMTGSLITPGVTAEYYSFDNFGLGRAAVMSKSGGGMTILAKSGDEGIDTTTYGFHLFTADFGGAVIKSIDDPVDPQDATNKRWVEQLVSQGTHIIAAVRAATTGNVTSLSGTTTIDGVALVAGDRVLVKEQTTASQNGVYIVNTGAWTKLPNDSDQSSLVTVIEGTTQTRHQYYNQDGTTWVLYWVDDDYYATVNGGLELDGNGFGFGIKALGVTNTMLAGSISQDKLAGVNIDDDAKDWVDMGQTSGNVPLAQRLGDFYSAILKMRGTPYYNTNNTQTISDAYSKIESKNSVAYGTGVPPAGNPGGADGDIYLRRLA